jgi:hypothetical protein
MLLSMLERIHEKVDIMLLNRCGSRCIGNACRLLHALVTMLDKISEMVKHDSAYGLRLFSA